MQDLGLSDYTPRHENRLKTLFWPAIENEQDIDTVTRQGFWLCILLSGVTALMGFAVGFSAVVLEAIFFFLAGTGVRLKSIAAAAGALVVYTFVTFLLLRVGVENVGVVRVIVTALLLANLRATWISARLRLAATEPPPVPLEGSWSERLSDRMPMRVWPWGRWVFYLVGVLMLLDIGAGLLRLARP